MAGADLRGFAYALESILRQRQWQFDAALARLGKLRRQIEEWDAEREKLQCECMAQAAQATRVWSTRADPAAQARLLGYLTALQQRRADAEREITALTELVKQAYQECAAQHQKLEALDQHRADSAKAYGIEQNRKSSAQSDQDWSARDSHRALERHA
jgi:chromosome segregation ATPase